MISCETRQLAGEVPLRKTARLVEAPLGSLWLEALDMADCKQLMNLLEDNPCQVMQKSEEGFTVLHAAAVRGCLKLLDQIFDLFEGNDRQFVDEREGIELSLQELCEAEGVYSGIYEEGIDAAGLTAAEFAWWSIGDCEAWNYLRYDMLGYITIFVNLGLFQHFETITNIRTWMKSHRHWRML